MPRSSLARPLALLLLAACSSSPTTTKPVDNTDKLEIVGGDMSGYNQYIYVRLNGTFTPGLTVTVNTAAMTDNGGGIYGGHLPAAVAAGGQVQVVVTNGTITATGTGVVPATPVITNESHTTIGAPVSITWTSATSPDSFMVSLNYHLPDGSAAAVIARLGGSARQVSLPTTEIPANGVVYSIGILALMNGAFTGDAATTSNMHLRASTPSYPVTIP